MPAPTEYKQEDSGLDPNPGQQLVESNLDSEDKPICPSLTDNIHEELFNSIKQYEGKEWSELEHLLKVPEDSENDEDENDDWSPASSEASTDSHDDTSAQDLHDLVNVLDTVIRSHTNLNCETTVDEDYLDLDIYNYETLLAEVRSWKFDVDSLIGES